MKECFWYAEIEFDNIECDFGVIVEDTFENLVNHVIDARVKKFDYGLGSCPNLKVLNVGYDNKNLKDKTSLLKGIMTRIEKLEGSEDTRLSKVDSVSFVSSLPSSFISDTVEMIESLWTCYDTTEHQNPKDMEHSLQKIQDEIWRWKTKYNEEIENVRDGK